MLDGFGRYNVGDSWTFALSFTAILAGALAMKLLVWSSCVALLFFTTGVQAADAAKPTDKPRAMTLDDLFAFKRISDPQISPDGKTIAYAVTTVDLAKNSTASTIWLAPTDGRFAAAVDRRDPNTTAIHGSALTASNCSSIPTAPAKASSGSSTWPAARPGSSPRSRPMPTAASGRPTASGSPSCRRSIPSFPTSPLPRATPPTRSGPKRNEKNPVKARVFDKLFYRHWDSWVEGKRQHLFVVPATGGEPRDLTPGDRDAYPDLEHVFCRR